MTTQLFGNRDCVACEGSGWIIGTRMGDPEGLCPHCNPTGAFEFDDDDATPAEGHSQAPFYSSALSSSGNIHIDADGVTIAKITPCAHQQGNRDLFLAAPDLLQALIYLVNAHEHPVASSRTRPGVLDHVPPALEQAKVAIGKAMGEAA